MNRIFRHEQDRRPTRQPTNWWQQAQVQRSNTAEARRLERARAAAELSQQMGGLNLAPNPGRVPPHETLFNFDGRLFLLPFSSF